MEPIKYYYEPYNIRVFTKFGEKVYLECGNVLRAAYLKRVEFVFKKYNPNEPQTIDVNMFFNAAGLGEYLLSSLRNVHGDPRDSGIHKSFESFRNKSDELNWNWTRLNETLPIIFNGIANVRIVNNLNSSDFVVYRWKWNGIKPIKIYLEFSKATLTENGWVTDAVIPENTYATENECWQSNQISVIEFE